MNMSYCRFRNTSKDADDCRDALIALFTGQAGEDNEPLSTRELRAARNLIVTCAEIVSKYADAADIRIDLDEVFTSLGGGTVLDRANDAVRKRLAETTE